MSQATERSMRLVGLWLGPADSPSTAPALAAAVPRLELALARAVSPFEAAQVARGAQALADIARTALKDRWLAARCAVTYGRAARTAGALFKALEREPGKRTDRTSAHGEPRST